jgi:hypothetical protein
VFGSFVGSNLLADSGHSPNSERLNFAAMLKGYFLAYLQGKFTLRDGTVLGKPTSGTTNAANGTTVTISDATESGIATVFMEALSDYGNGTPIFYQTTNSTNQVSDYRPIAQVFKAANLLTNYGSDSNTLILVYANRVTAVTNYFLNGKIPTAVAFLPKLPVVPDYATKIQFRGGLTAQEAQFILSVSSLTETESKTLAGILIRSIGGASGGGAHFGFGSLHFSLGDNKILAEIVEDLLASSSYHTALHDLTKVFWKFDGKDKRVRAILDDFSSLLEKIKSSVENSTDASATAAAGS